MIKKSPSNDSMGMKPRATTGPTECKICRAPATYSYFGAIVCQSCKMFFKRNAEQGQVILKCAFYFNSIHVFFRKH